MFKVYGYAFFIQTEIGARPSVRSLSGRPLAHRHPRQVLFGEYVPGWPKLAGAVKCADIEMRLGRQAHGFASQCRAAPDAKPAPGSSRRRIELRYLTFSDRISGVLECDKNRSRCAAMLTATLAMAPIYAFRLTCRSKTHGAAEALTLLVGRAAHDLILHPLG